MSEAQEITNAIINQRNTALNENVILTAKLAMSEADREALEKLISGFEKRIANQEETITEKADMINSLKDASFSSGGNYRSTISSMEANQAERVYRGNVADGTREPMCGSGGAGL